MSRRIIACGGRSYADRARVDEVLGELHAAMPIGVIIEGGAGGADSLARSWGDRYGCHVITVRAEWRRLGLRAGPVRNRRMLEMLCNVTTPGDLVVAFPGGRGTANMVRLARAAGVHVLEVDAT